MDRSEEHGRGIKTDESEPTQPTAASFGFTTIHNSDILGGRITFERLFVKRLISEPTGIHKIRF